MTADDLLRKRIDALLRDVREQHDRVLVTLADGVAQLVSTETDAATREAEAALTAQTQTRVEALQSAATTRIAQAEEDAAAKIAAVRAESAGDLQRARAESAREVSVLETRIAQIGQERDLRIAASNARIAELEREGATQLAEMQARLADVERDRDQRSAPLAATAAPLHAAPKGETDLEMLDRLLGGLQAVDAARTLTETLDALAAHTAREASRVAILLLRGGRFRGWRAMGFDKTVPSAAAIDLAPQDAGIVADAAQTRRRTATSDREADPTSAATPTHGAPSFASLAADRAGLAVPLIVGGHVVAVLYADDGGDGAARRASSGWTRSVEVLARHAARCLEALTASKAARLWPAGARPAEAWSFDSPDESAKRYARLLVLEIKLYHQPAIDAGRHARDLAERLAPQIAQARALYEERIGPGVRSRMDYFNQELVRTLADGNPGLLGAAQLGSAS